MFERFTLMAGPCVLEDDGLNLEVGRALAALSAKLALPIVFKASYDKANRSKADSPRGPGLEKGLERLARVREETGLPVITDVTEPAAAQQLPASFTLHQPHPNPFNAQVTVPIELSRSGHLTVTVVNTLGQSVTTLHDGPASAGPMTLNRLAADRAGS